LDCTLNSIIEEQYQLAKYVNISVMESGELVDFERSAYLSLLIRDKKKENELLKMNK
jgi:hypothetical protein